MRGDVALPAVALTEQEIALRVRDLELDVARIGQRVEDHENDIRVFAPLVTEQATARQALDAMREDVHEAHEGIRALRELLSSEAEERRRQLATEREERKAGQEERRRELAEAVEERRKETTQTRTLIKVAAIGLIGTFVTSGAAVLAAILTGAGH